ncbi:hypothetical protein PUMCH_001120 [Australozyma saopauloensis]|uniref:BHLH domain-containing protein n=1 Tax=Australozyma saopauloensis TaxID=291208 RepID=A0AAX4H5U7_9ASCO|nr:hypothetical protein PUMCH_001120 [[Candida] saopauloensis]
MSPTKFLLLSDTVGCTDVHISCNNQPLLHNLYQPTSFHLLFFPTQRKSIMTSPNPRSSASIKIEPGLPVNAELLGRSLDIKKQLTHSLQGGGPSSGGVLKLPVRRNSVHVKNEDDNDDEEQHNERKRRDDINERIQELLTLIPQKYFRESAKEGLAGLEDNSSKSTGTKDGKPNKGQILTQAVEYIQALQNSIDENNRKEVELLLKMKTFQMQQEGKVNVPISVGATSAELALGEIGVGPHSQEYFKAVLARKSED